MQVNDRMNLRLTDITALELNGLGDLLLQDAFQVSKPTRYFQPKRETEYQLFLFRTHLLLAKRERLSVSGLDGNPNRILYTVKHRIAVSTTL